MRGRVAAALAQLDTVDPLRLGLLWLESDLPLDVEVLSRAATVASSRLDLALAERLARGAHEANASPATTLQLAYILYLREKGEAAEALLDTLDARELVAPGFVDGVILRAANLLLPLRSPERARIVIDDAVQLGDADRNHALYTLRAVGQAMAAQPAETLETMSAVDYNQLDSYGRILGYAAETIALGDLGRAERQASERPRDIASSSNRRRSPSTARAWQSSTPTRRSPPGTSTRRIRSPSGGTDNMRTCRASLGRWPSRPLA